MNCEELVTIAKYKLPVKIVMFNNNSGHGKAVAENVQQCTIFGNRQL